MANIKSQIKRNRQNERRRTRNRSVRSALKSDAKRARAALAGGDLEAAGMALRETSRGLDKAVSRGVVHRRTAARRKSRLARAVARGSAGS